MASRGLSNTVQYTTNSPLAVRKQRGFFGARRRGSFLVMPAMAKGHITVVECGFGPAFFLEAIFQSFLARV
jgi:hypothetical protein